MQILRRIGNNAKIFWKVPGKPGRTHPVCFEQATQQHLNPVRYGRNFVEKERAAFGLVYISFKMSLRIFKKGIPKQLFFKKFGWNRIAVDDDKRPFCIGALTMNFPSNHMATGPFFSQDQHTCRTFCCALNFPSQGS